LNFPNILAGSNIIYYGGRGNGPKTTIYDDLFILDTSTGTWFVKALLLIIS